jgi:hypothetical protein
MDFDLVPPKQAMLLAKTKRDAVVSRLAASSKYRPPSKFTSKA